MRTQDNRGEIVVAFARQDLEQFFGHRLASFRREFLMCVMSGHRRLEKKSSRLCLLSRLDFRNKIAAFLHPQRLHLYRDCLLVYTAGVFNIMSNKPDLFLRSALVRRLKADPRAVSLRHAEPVAFLVTSAGRRLELFSATKIELHPERNPCP
jgi:hypothetical protein